jgi:polar amino acid transport system substrate-binding protein
MCESKPPGPLNVECEGRFWFSLYMRFQMLLICCLRLRSVIGVLCCSALTAAHSADRLNISTSVVAPYTQADQQGFLDQLIPAVFREVGVQAQVLVYAAASERSLINANEGIDDGQALRVAGLEKLYPNLIQVPEPVIDNDFVAMSIAHDFPTSSWNALQPYSVTYIIGWKIFENQVPPSVARTPVREAEQLFTLLERGRVDVALYERWQGLAQARAQGLRAVRVMEPPLVRTKMYMYLHKKHAALVPRVALALAELKRNGAYQRIHDKTLGSLLKP